MNDTSEPHKPDPKRLLEQALAGMTETAAPRLPLPTAEELQAALPQFEILGLVGHGGMGGVFRARDTRLERIVAIKVLPKERVQDAEFEERFLREARAQAALNHPNILTVYDFGRTDSFVYLVSEFVDGVDLRQLLRMGRLSAAESLRLVPQICDALQFAHDHGVVHRDIKPENILVDQAGAVRIVDFGLAKMLDAGDVTLTRTEQAMGTPHYMAPEQMLGAAGVDHRADIYALGVVLYEMLTGQLPLGHFAPPSKAVGTREELDAVVMRALAQAVEDRYQSAGQVKTDVEAMDGHPITERSEAEPPPGSPAPGSRFCRRPLVGIGILVLLAIASKVVGALLADAQAASMAIEDAWEQYDSQQEMIRALKEHGMSFEGSLVPRPVAPRPEDAPSDPLSVSFGLIGIFGFLAALAMTVLGFSGIGAIRRAPDRLHGLGCAVFVAWLFPLFAINAPFVVLVEDIRDEDVHQVAVIVVLLVLLVLDVVWLRWQHGRHVRYIEHVRGAR